MEKMSQVSVSEFMNLTKEEMYDNAVKMVEKYNRLVKENERKITYADELNKDIAKKAVKIKLLEQEIEGRKEGYWALKEKYDKLEKELEIRTKENESLIAVKNRQEKELEAHEAELKGIVKSKEYWRTKYLVTQEERDAFMEDAKALRTANEILVEKSKEHLDEIKKLKEEIEGVKKAFNDLREETANRYITIETHNDICKTYEKGLDYYKNQERIRTDQLRATESKVEELWKEIEKFTKGEDDYGKSGFKRYIEHLIEEEERAVPERFKERLNKEITEIFTKEKETEVSGIPCGEDAIE